MKYSQVNTGTHQLAVRVAAGKMSTEDDVVRRSLNQQRNVARIWHARVEADYGGEVMLPSKAQHSLVVVEREMRR